ncbi:MAG: ABC transporter permease [Anaerolineae bacterium]
MMRRRGWARVWYRYGSMIVGMAIVGSIVLAAVVGPLLWRLDPTALNPSIRLQAPSREHPLGLDDMGRDVLSQMLYGARTSLRVGLGTILLCGVLGTVLGMLSGYVSKLDGIIMRFLDGLMAFPAILLGLALMAAWGQSEINLILALAVVYTPSVARLVRSLCLTLREQDYVQAARAVGCSDLRIVVTHIFPGSLGPLCVQLTFLFAVAVLAEAALSFLGVGIPPYLPTLGNIISHGRVHAYRAPWLTVYPGLAISLTVLGLNLLGDGLRDLVDPTIATETRG